MIDKFVVFGGSGFFGQRLVRLAAQRGYQVVSVSRKGAPIPDEAWHKEVEWVRGDVFAARDWRFLLNDATVVVDCIGIIRQKKSHGVTYQKFNIEAAQILASESKVQEVPLFVYLSAKPFLPFVLKKYFSSKKQAEKLIYSYYSNPLIIRPSLFIGKERLGTRTLGQLTKVAHTLGFFKSFQPQLVEEGARGVLEQIESKIRTL